VLATYGALQTCSPSVVHTESVSLRASQSGIVVGAQEQLSMARVKRGKRKAAAVTPAGPAAAPPALPPDVLADIAERAFEANGCTSEARMRFSSVCVAWRTHMKGEDLYCAAMQMYLTPAVTTCMPWRIA